MSLRKYLIIEGKKDIIVNKIGLSDNIADELLRRVDDRFVIYWANLIKTHIELYGNQSKNTFEQSFRTHPLIGVILRLEALIKNSRTPNLPSELKRIFKLSSDKIILELENYVRPIRFNAYLHNYIDQIAIKYKYIADYATATNQNFQNADFLEVAEEAEQWHDQIEQGATGKALQIEDHQIIIKEYDDGYYWLDLRDNNCQLEGGSMGHCGNTDADTLLSLRDEKGEPHVTVAYDYNNVYRQMKGKGNKKPHEKYHEYIVDLFIEVNEVDDNFRHDYYIDYYDSEYEPEDDFNIFDLNDQLFKKVTNKLDEDEIIGLIENIDYEEIIRRLDYKEIDIIRPSGDFWSIVAKKIAVGGELQERIMNLSKRGEFIDLLIEYEYLDDRYQNLKYYTTGSLVMSSADEREKLIKAIINKDELYSIRIMTNIFNYDIFYKK